MGEQAVWYAPQLGDDHARIPAALSLLLVCLGSQDENQNDRKRKEEAEVEEEC